MRPVVTGSIAFDYLMSFPGKFEDHFLPGKLDKISVSFLVDELNLRRGGCAANIAYSLALLGEKPLLVGAAGSDFGPYGKDLENMGVDLSGVLVKEDVLTASFFANTDQEGNQIASFFTGAMQYAREISLPRVVQERDPLVLISPDDPEAMSLHAEECRKEGYRFLYDPGQQIARTPGETLARDAKGAWILLVNEYEEEMFLKKTGMGREDLRGLAENVVVTLGAEGAEIRTPQGDFRIPPARPERVLDPTGVGDAYRAGLVKGLVKGLSWETAGRMGSLAAVYVLETDGPQSHHYDLGDFVERYAATFGDAKELEPLLEGEG